jgi:hypothetical protein
MYMHDQHALILLHAPGARASLPPPRQAPARPVPPRARRAAGGSHNHGDVTL